MATKSRRTHGKSQVPVGEAVQRAKRAALAKVSSRRRGTDAAVLADARRALALVKGRR